MATISLKELKYSDQLVLVEMARKALAAKTDQNGNIIHTTYATKEEIASILTIEVVDTLPTASAETYRKIYLVPAASPISQNIKIEYITIRSGTEGSYTYSWEKLGDTSIDLSNYYTKTESDNKFVAKESGKSLIATTEITRLSGMATGATKTEASSTNGKIKINGSDVTVYTSSISATDVSIDW